MRLSIMDAISKELDATTWSAPVEPLTPYTSTKDIEQHPWFRGLFFPHVWRFYMHRFTSAGHAFLWLTLILLCSAGSAVDLKMCMPVAYLLAIWLIVIIAFAMSRPKVSAVTRHVDHISAGETLSVDVEITRNSGGAGTDLFIWPECLPLGVDYDDHFAIAIPPLSPDEKTTVRYVLKCRKRGVYTLQGHRVETDFPFGVLRASRVVREPRPLVVYPAFTPLVNFRIPTGRKYQPGGVALASNLGESFEFLGNRDYRNGDSPRDIDWRATARLDRPIVREYREEYFTRVAVILDTYIPAGKERSRGPAFERAVSLCASVSDYLARQDYIVDLFAAGPNLYHLTAGRSLAYLDQILDILACVDSCPTQPFTVIEPELQATFSQINTVICIFLDWDETRQQLIDKFGQEGAGVKPIIVSDELPGPIPVSSAAGGMIPVLTAQAFEHGIVDL